jgi:ATP-binding cassette subfamily B protein
MQGSGRGGMRSLIRATDEKPKVTLPLLKRVLYYAVPYRRLIIITLLVILVNSTLSLLNPLIMRDLIDRTIPDKDINRLILLSIALLLIPTITGGLNVLQRRLSARVGEGVIYDLRVSLYAALQRMSLRFFTNTKVGELMSRLNNDVVGAQNAISNTIVGIITNLIQGVLVLLVMLNLEWRLTLLSVAVLPFFIFATRRMGNRLRDIARSQMESNARMNALMGETLNIGGALLVKLFGRKSFEVDRFSQRAKSVRDIGIQRAFMGSIFITIIGLLTAVGTSLVYGLGGYFVILGQFTIGTIVALGAYLGSLYGVLQNLTNAPVEFATSMVSFERVFEVIDLPADIPEKESPIELAEIKGEISFEDVSFIYETGDEILLSDVHRYGSVDSVTNVLSEPEESGKIIESTDRSQARTSALEQVTFKVVPGQLVALVGPSGAGKTTLTYLIPRMYDPTSGVIRIDGHDLKGVSLDSLSRQIGMVTQETYLFHDTIRTNLQYARLNATQSEMEEACRVANIHHFIQELPERYDTVVGERGYRLSGGEKQRLALARVILKDPKILVLDEATSNLDSESERLIQEALKRVMEKRTSIVIAHRLSTILAADQILVIDRGKIVEKGTHPQLVTKNGLYAHLYQTQFKNEAPGTIT